MTTEERTITTYNELIALKQELIAYNKKEGLSENFPLDAIRSEHINKEIEKFTSPEQKFPIFISVNWDSGDLTEQTIQTPFQ